MAITALAPAASALTMSPEYFVPPSAMMATPRSLAARAQLATALSCGTPVPVTTRVVQIEPAPTPTLKMSAPASMRSEVPSAVATLPEIKVRKP